jgi:hypothetical protein
MSNISSVPGAIPPYQPTSQVSLYAQAFQSVGSALQAGDLSSAQSALTSFQQNLRSYSPSAAQQPFGRNSQANAAYQNLAGTLQSGDLSAAQRAFTDLQTSLSSAHNGRQDRGSESTQAATSPATTTPATSTLSTGGANANSTTDSDGDGDNDGSVLNVTA